MRIEREKIPFKRKQDFASCLQRCQPRSIADDCGDLVHGHTKDKEIVSGRPHALDSLSSK